MLITKAFRTTSNKSLQVIAQKPPIDIIIKQRQKLQQIKWGNSINIISGTLTPIDVEWPFPFKDTINYGIPIDCSYDNNYSINVDIYTDGSRINDSVGCSFVAYYSNNEIYQQNIRLNNRCTVFQAEMYAIKSAIMWSESTFDHAYIHILTDSLSAYNIIYGNNLHYMAEEIRNMIRLSTSNYEITWVKAHCGIKGNERADTLAKQAAENKALPINYNKLSLQALRRLLWNDSIQTWQNIWNMNSDHIMYEFIPDIYNLLSLKWYIPNYYTTQMFSGHGKFASYLYRFTNRINNYCTICLVEDGPKHYLYDCVMLEKERLELKLLLGKHGICWPCNLSDIWKNREIYYAFCELAKKTNFITYQTIHN
ncbi:uncharacterized protein LOC111614873 [Centruroides sculpturatus]|uniref:uncharacterized protein LOC111614873 n=1 Tax=Centruroides sculpturatus TaxID=218467 RepID=UPI000C6E26E5|nr:uncharacterized protein LOC111614873 [Centruroides sculpturatus]